MNMITSSLGTRSHVGFLSGFLSWLNACLPQAWGSCKQLFEGRFLSALLPSTPSFGILPPTLGNYCLIIATWSWAGNLGSLSYIHADIKVQPCVLWFLVTPSLLILSLFYQCEEKSSIYPLIWGFSLLALSSLRLPFYCQLSDREINNAFVTYQA